MPELPEVQTIVNDLNSKVKGFKILDVWTDWPKYFRRSKGGFNGFKKEIKNKKIEKVWRVGKNIIFGLHGLPAKPAAKGAGRRGNKDMLIHQKMTGHILIGKWNMKRGIWVSAQKGLLNERVNGYIHVMFHLSNGPSNKVGASKMMALSDLRKFAKILIFDDKDLNNLDDVKNIGPDPLKPGFAFSEFKALIKKNKGPIKKVLLYQDVVSGIGNIYADEILFASKIHPLRKVESLSDGDLKLIFSASKNILKKAIKMRGTSTSDFRDTSGKAGSFGKILQVYRRSGEQCQCKCGGEIKRIKIAGRSAHFCPNCQKL